jgi:hypothetical protein
MCGSHPVLRRGPKQFLKKTFPELFHRMALAKHRLRFAWREGPELFAMIFERHFWDGSASRSGSGSDLTQTKRIREVLPILVEELGVRSVLDVPCGDFYWMSRTDLRVEKYIGADVVKELIAANSQAFRDDRRTFIVMDVTKDALPKVDLILCRDCFVHLSYEDIRHAIGNINKCGARYFLTTTFVDRETNTNTRAGAWRPINLEKPPFSLKAPIRVINEGCTEGDGAYADKSLALWRLPL